MVKNLLEKLEHVLTDKMVKAMPNFVETLEIDTFLDTPLDEFIKVGYVKPSYEISLTSCLGK